MFSITQTMHNQHNQHNASFGDTAGRIVQKLNRAVVGAWPGRAYLGRPNVSITHNASVLARCEVVPVFVTIVTVYIRIAAGPRATRAVWLASPDADGLRTR